MIRKLCILLSVLSFSILTMGATDYRLFLEDFNIDAGESKDISLYMDNVGEITGIQADIILPEGLSVVIDDEGYYCVTLNSTRKTRNHTIDGYYQADGAFRIVSYTPDSKPFKLNTGEIATITITASSEFKGIHTIAVRNIELAAPDGTQFFPESESCIVTGPASEEPNGYRVYIEDFNIAAGETATVGLMMENPDEITGIQTDIYLPEGLSVAIDDEDYYCIELNPDRKTRNHTIDGNYQEDGSFRIISYTSDSKAFKQNSGAVAFITLQADDNFKGTHIIRIMNTELANPSGTQFWPFDETCTVTSTASAHTLRGDVDGEGHVNMDDLTALINFLLTSNDSGINLANAASCDWPDSNTVNMDDLTALINYLLSGSWPIHYEFFSVNGETFKMVAVDGGTFTMGDKNNEAIPDHQVTLSSYYIGETEVTQALWEAVMGNNPSYFAANANNHPVENISWNDCQQFITNLNSLTDMDFRLPTEAEWEFAARGGNQSNGFRYSGSNIIEDVAWYMGNNLNWGSKPVATKMPNELGLYDMSGNVFEWCNDGYNGYSHEAQINPTGDDMSPYRVFRGGYWGDFEEEEVVSFRRYNYPSYTFFGLGLRLAR